MESEWKAALYEFIRQNNELEIEGTVASIAGIRDERYLNIQQHRLARLAEENKERRITRVKNELHLKLLDAKKSGNSVNAVCKMSRRMHYVQSGRQLVEERIEYAQIQLRRDLRNWSVVQIKPYYSEESAPAAAFAELEMPSERKPSRPFLHPSIRLQPAEPSHRYVYDREAVRHYADMWWDVPNPEYIHFKVDCTNFVSQCLYAGGVPMDYTNKREQGWWYRGKNDQWSFSWSVAHSLYWTLSHSQSVFRATQVDSPEQLEIGDCILYDWDGSGRFGHSVIVAAKDAYGLPLVNAHTTNSKHRYWDYKDSYAWSDHTRYAFFHIS